MTAAEKQRRYRRRQRRDLRVYKVEAPEHCVLSALLESGRLSEAEALDKRRVEKALSEIIIDFSKRWKESRYR